MFKFIRFNKISYHQSYTCIPITYVALVQSVMHENVSISAFCDSGLKFCTDTRYGPQNRFSAGDTSQTLSIFVQGHALFQCNRENINLAPEGRRDFSDTSKCAQESHLYRRYEATYSLKRLVSEKIAKNYFLTYANSVILRNS